MSNRSLRTARAVACVLSSISLPLLAAPDNDADGIPDIYDNCPEIANPMQFDSDADWIGNVCDDDDDNDGLTDQWELDNGTDPNDAADALADPDGDGRSNYDEFLAGSDPHSNDLDSDNQDTDQPPLDSNEAVDDGDPAGETGQPPVTDSADNPGSDNGDGSQPTVNDGSDTPANSGGDSGGELGDGSSPGTQDGSPAQHASLSQWTVETANTWLQNYVNAEGEYLEIEAPASATFSVRNDDIDGNFNAPLRRVLTLDLLPKYGALTNAAISLASSDVNGGWRYPLTEELAAGRWHALELQFDPGWDDATALAAGWVRWGEPVSFAAMMRSVAALRLLGGNSGALPLVLGVRNLAFSANPGSGSEQMTHWTYPGRWEPISMPCLPHISERHPAGILADDIAGQYGHDWQLYRIDPLTGRYQVQGYYELMALNQVYWLINTADRPRLIDMPASCGVQPRGTLQQTLSVASDRMLTLSVGNPYAEALPLADLHLLTVTGACSSLQGCRWDEAAANGYTAPRVFRWDSGRETYVTALQSDAVPSWESLQFGVLPGLFGLGARLYDVRQAEPDFTAQ